jgi:hypothetical protein
LAEPECFSAHQEELICDIRAAKCGLSASRSLSIALVICDITFSNSA